MNKVRWLISVPTLTSFAGEGFFAASFSAFHSGYHSQHNLPPHSDIEAYQVLHKAVTHGYFSIRVNERLALQDDPKTHLPRIIHAFMLRAPNPTKGTHVTDTELTIGAVLTGGAPQYTDTFPMNITIIRDDRKSQVTVGTVYFQGVKVTGYVAVRDGYIFDFMVTDKFREAF
jgi:hypothetical protein